MAILNPEHLLEQAARLIASSRPGPTRQADLRRAISTAYYSVFHATLTAAADSVAGRVHRGTPRYTTVYRSIEHRTLRAICEIAARPVLPPNYRVHVPGGECEPTIKNFADAVVWLQERRHEADYDPGVNFGVRGATVAIESAQSAVENWRAAPVPQREALLWLLLFRPRS